MKNNKLFDKIDSISKFKNLLELDEFSEALVSNLANEEVINRSFEEMDAFNKYQEDYFLRFLHFVDFKLNSNMKFSISRKIITILIGSIYIGNFYDRIKDYDLMHLMCISFYSFYDSSERYADNIEAFSKNVFECYKEKTGDFMYYISFNEIVQELYWNDKSEDEIINYLRSKTSEELLRESANIVEKAIEQGGFLI